MSTNKCKIEKGSIRSLFSPRKAGVHKWMKNQMNRFMRRKPIEDDEVGGKSNRKPIKGWEF
jgi:hypothetical protein